MRRLLILIAMLSVASVANAAGNQPASKPPPQKFVVFFQEWSAALDNAAQAVITQAAEFAKAHKGSAVHVGGFADPTGSRKANALLSDLRVQVVMDQLQADGVPAALLSGRGHGPVQFALSSQESRRVEIGIGSR